MVVTLGSIFILGIKYVFLHSRALYLFIKETLPEMFTCKRLPFLPFWLCIFALLIPLGPLSLLLAILASSVAGLACPYTAVTHGMNIKYGLKKALEILIMVDKKTYKWGWNFRLLRDRDLGLENMVQNKPSNDEPEYWSLFISNCKEVVKDAKEKSWVKEEDIEGAMPNVLTSIPAMAILKIILQSINLGGGRDVLVWDEDHICDPEDSVHKDNDLVEFFWPKVKSILKRVRNISKEEQLYMMAQLCANSEINTEALNTALIVLDIDDEKKTKVHKISADINELVIILLRMNQMQRRMSEFLI